jgi:hypothetical protein
MAPNDGHDRQRVHGQRLERQDHRAQEHEEHGVGRDKDEQRGPREVRADSADDVVDVRGAATDEHAHAGRWGQCRPSRRRLGNERPRPPARFGPYGVYSVNVVRSSFRRGASAACTNRSRGPFGSPYRQLVLLEGQAGVDVDQAGHAADARILGKPSRVVVELGKVCQGSLLVRACGSRARSGRTHLRRTPDAGGRTRPGTGRRAGGSTRPGR